MSMPAPVYYSADEVRDLIVEWRAWPRYELVYGELLVTPAPRMWHQRIISRLAFALGEYLRREPIGELFMSPADISWGPDTLVQPDIFVVPKSESRSNSWKDVKTLLFAAEVLSPSTERQDRFTKRRLYQEKDVATCWIVDQDRECVDIWTPDASFPATETDLLTWHPAGAGAPFVLSLRQLFAEEGS
jgi:Uma2 family endonuclease